MRVEFSSTTSSLLTKSFGGDPSRLRSRTPMSPFLRALRRAAGGGGNFEISYLLSPIPSTFPPRHAV
jgi:hypothetical protein